MFLGQKWGLCDYVSVKDTSPEAPLASPSSFCSSLHSSDKQEDLTFQLQVDMSREKKEKTGGRKEKSCGIKKTKTKKGKSEREE